MKQKNRQQKRAENRRKHKRTLKQTAETHDAFQEFQETTMQMPFGIGSLFWAVENDVITAAEGMTIAYMTRHSIWDKHKSFAKSYSNIAKALQLSIGYVKQLIRKVSKWLQSLKTTRTGKIYKLVPHVIPEGTYVDDLPIDAYDKPLKFAVPIKKGSPFEKLEAGKISWQACWLWLVMKLNSFWDGNKDNAGQTFPMSYETLKKRSGLSEHIISRSIKQLKNAGLLKRLSKPYESGVYQLYPKPPRTALKRKRNPKAHELDTVKEPVWDDESIYSFNGFYRIKYLTGEFELKRRGRWRAANRDQVPEHIRIDLEEFQKERIQIEGGLFLGGRYSEDTPNSGSGGAAHSTPTAAYSTPTAAYSDTPQFLTPPEPRDDLPF